MTETTAERGPNRLEQQLERLEEVPAFARGWYRNIVMRRALPFASTAGLEFVALERGQVALRMRNEKKVQNHLGGVHASAMNLLAETATGLVVGMNVRDDCVALVREARMHSFKQATADLHAVATLSEVQRALMQTSLQGEVNVAVVVTDEAGLSPVVCEFVWGWVPAGKAKQ